MITNEQLIEYLLTKGWEFSHSELTKTYYVHPDCQHRILTTPNLVFDTAIKILADFERLSFVDICNKIASQWLPFDPHSETPTQQGYCLLLTRDGSWYNCYNVSRYDLNIWVNRDGSMLKPLMYNEHKYKLVKL